MKIICPKRTNFPLLSAFNKIIITLIKDKPFDDRTFSKSGKILKYLAIFINIFFIHIVFINVDYI